MIYFAQTPTGSIKIGFTEQDIKSRMAQVGTTCGGRMTLLSTIPGDRGREREIHRQFEHLAMGREQFRPAADLMAFIGKPLLVDLNPDAVELAVPKGDVLIKIPVTLTTEVIAIVERVAEEIREPGKPANFSAAVRKIVLEWKAWHDQHPDVKTSDPLIKKLQG